MNANMTSKTVLTKRYFIDEFIESGFKTVIQESMKLVVKPNLGDYTPQIAGLHLQGMTKHKKDVAKVFDAFVEKIID